MSVKIRLQKGTAAATSKFPASICLTRGWDSQFSTRPSGQVATYHLQLAMYSTSSIILILN